MTTEEMNRVIAGYMGLHFDLGCTWENEPPNFMKANFELEYSNDWTTLMPVWQKLRGELEELSIWHDNEHLCRLEPSNTQAHLYDDICDAIITCDITTAHRLMVEAIELIKK